MGAPLDRALIGRLGVRDTEGHAVGRGAVVASEFLGLTLRRHVQQEGDIALFQPDHAAVGAGVGVGEAHQLQPFLHRLRVRTGEFDELEAIHAQGVGGVDSRGGGFNAHGASPEFSRGRSDARATLHAGAAAGWPGT